jgi:putative MATE family efflux protein
LLLDPIDRALCLRIWSLTWPMILANALEMTVGLVDLLLARPFGPAATATMGVSRQVTFVVESAASAITAGVLTLVSQEIGSQSNRVRAVVLQSLRCVLLFGVPISLAGFLLSRYILLALQVQGQRLAWGESYLRIYFAGLLFSWGNLVGMAILRGAGDVRTPLTITLGVSVLNAGLSYVLIYGAGPVPAFELPGLALGTVGARFCGVLVYLAILSKRRAKSEEGSTKEIPSFAWRILRIGVPVAIANTLRHGSRLVFLAIVGASFLGVSLQAAIGLGLQIRLLGVLIALAFQTATATLVGQAIGKGQTQQADMVGRRSLQLLGLLMGLLLGIMVVLAEPLAELFLTEEATLGARVLRWFAVAQLFSAMSIGMQGALMGAGDTVPALRYTLISEWGVMLPLAYLLSLTSWGFPESLLVCWTLAPAFTLIFMYRRWRSGRWKELRW